LLVLLAYQTLVTADDRNGVKHYLSSYAFVRSAATNGCLRKSAILAEAQRRGWEVQEPDPWGNIPSSIRVMVEPPRAFVKNPGMRFIFDEDGCATTK